MTKVVFNRTVPMIDRDSFLTPFDKMFDQIVSAQFPEMTKTVGVNPMQGTAYPKVNVYEYDDKVGVVAEIPGLDKKDLSIDVEDGVLTVAGNKHGLFDDTGATDKITGWKTGSDKIHIDISAYATELGANAKETIITGAGGHAAIASAINTLKDVADGATVTLTNEDMVKVTDTTGNNSNADLTFTIKNNAASSKGAAAMLFTWYDRSYSALRILYITLSSWN